MENLRNCSSTETCCGYILCPFLPSPSQDANNPDGEYFSARNLGCPGLH